MKNKKSDDYKYGCLLFECLELQETLLHLIKERTR